MAFAHLHVISETAVASDAYATITAAHVRIGEPAWDWRMPIVFVRARPEIARDPVLAERFRGSLDPLHRRHVANNPDLFDLEYTDELTALFEYDRGVSLERICSAATSAAVLPRAVAARIIDAIDAGLRARHDLGVAHGAVNLDSISVRGDGGVTIGIGRPWDPAARPRDDLACADRLRRELLARATAVAREVTVADFMKRFR